MLAVAVRIRSVTTAAVAALEYQVYRKSTVLELRCWIGMCAFLFEWHAAFRGYMCHLGFWDCIIMRGDKYRVIQGFAVDICVASISFL